MSDFEGDSFACFDVVLDCILFLFVLDCILFLSFSIVNCYNNMSSSVLMLLNY